MVLFTRFSRTIKYVASCISDNIFSQYFNKACLFVALTSYNIWSLLNLLNYYCTSAFLQLQYCQAWSPVPPWPRPAAPASRCCSSRRSWTWRPAWRWTPACRWRPRWAVIGCWLAVLSCDWSGVVPRRDQPPPGRGGAQAALRGQLPAAGHAGHRAQHRTQVRGINDYVLRAALVYN